MFPFVSFTVSCVPFPQRECVCVCMSLYGPKIDAFHYWQNITLIWNEYGIENVLYATSLYITFIMNVATGNQLMDPFKPFHICSFYHNKLFVGFCQALL